jgi:MFS family permease
MIRALRQRDFALLWLGGLISMAGDWVLIIGLPIYIFLLTHSVLQTSLMVVAGRAPSIIFSSLAGVLIDRWDRKRTLIVTNLLLAVALLPLALVVSPDLLWIIYAVLVVETVLESFVLPAQNALIPVLVSEETLVSANSLNSVGSNVARLGGPALGGLVAAKFGLNGIVVADAASFLLAALLIGLIASKHTRAAHLVPTHQAEEMSRRGSRLLRGIREWVDGLRLIGRERVLLVVLGAFAITSLGEGVMGALYPIFVNVILHGEALQIGELMSAQAVGGLLGGLIAGWVGHRMLSRKVIGCSAVLFGLLDLAIFNVPGLLASVGVPIFAIEIGLFIAVGLPAIGMSTGTLTLVQAKSPDAYRGRVFGILGMLMGLLGVVGTLLAGFFTDRLGVVTMLNIQGAGYVVAGLLLLTLLPSKLHVPASTPLEEPALIPMPETITPGA